MANKRQSIVDAVVARLKTITTANGYTLNIGSRVYDWRMNPARPAELPIIELRDGDAPIEIVNMDCDQSHRLHIDIVVMTSGSDAASKARSGLQDVSRAIHTDITFSGLAKVFMPESTALEVQQDEQTLAAGRYSFSLTYYTAFGEI